MEANATLARDVVIRGRSVPKIGLGTWQLNGSECEEAVRDALEIGYRHIDTARIYGNEREVGRAIADSGVPREQIFITTKVWMEDFAPSRLRAAAEDSLRSLRTDYVDLMLLHWPEPAVPIEQSLAVLIEMRERGLISELGVSNYTPHLLREALELAPLFCNQVEYHPLLGQESLLSVAEESDLLVGAYAPMAHGRIFDERALAEIGEAHGVGAGQVALRWLVEQPRVAAVPKAASHRNRLANFDIWDFALSDEERGRIAALPKDRRVFDPEWAPEWDD